MRTGTWASLNGITGGLSKPSKMPCQSYSLPAEKCKVGSKLRRVPGSVCASCYAHKGMYGLPCVQSAMYRRLDAITGDNWIDAMVVSIKKTGNNYFRWHDSGDIQSLKHLEMIADICRQTPRVKHWLPTHETEIVTAFRQLNTIPENLIIRTSAAMVNDAGIDLELPRSAVHTWSPPDGFKACRAKTRGGHCGNCRACWDPNINVSYPKH